MTDRLCSNLCGKVLGRKNRSGMCNACFNRVRNSCPEYQVRKAATLRLKWATDPEWAAQQRARMIEISKRPDVIEKKRAVWMRNKVWLRSAPACPPGSPSRMLAGARGSATKLAHIPTDYRSMYRDLVKRGTRAKEAEKIILDHAETESARFRRKVGAS